MGDVLLLVAVAELLMAIEPLKQSSVPPAIPRIAVAELLMAIEPLKQPAPVAPGGGHARLQNY